MPAWDQYDAYLFDIDGTLLHCTDAVHYFAFCDALTAVAGRPLNLDGVNAHGNVDVGILRDAFTLAFIPQATWRPRLEEIRERMCRHVERNAAGFRIEVLPAVPEILQHLRSRGKILGVATGNLEAIGRAKLRHAGLLDYFHFGGFSDRHEYRADVFRAAIAQAQALTSPTACLCVVGDTPQDIDAAQANAVDVIAVATGIYPFATLAAENPTLCLQTLKELSAITHNSQLETRNS